MQTRNFSCQFLSSFPQSKLVAAEAAEKMTRLYNSACVDGAAKKQTKLELQSVESEPNRLICVIHATDTAISATELNELWQTYKTNLLVAHRRWNECKDLGIASEVAK